VVARLEAEVNAALQARLGEEYSKEDTLTRAAWVKTVTVWAMEIYCDLFGILLLGPCFAYAYVEAYDLCAALNPAGTIAPEELQEALAFYPKHPSHYFRVQQQAAFLKESAWWKSVTETNSHVSLLIQQTVEIPNDAHVVGSKYKDGFVWALIDLLPQIRSMIGEVFGGVDDGWNEYSQVGKHVKAYLRNGVVPSSLVVREGSESTKPEITFPSPLVLLNAGVEFYLTELDDLIRSVPKEDETAFDRRLHWVRRIEEWVAKAIEDQRLIPKVDPWAY
jgi:hypothetical protein